MTGTQIANFRAALAKLDEPDKSAARAGIWELLNLVMALEESITTEELIRTCVALLDICALCFSVRRRDVPANEAGICELCGDRQRARDKRAAQAVGDERGNT